MTVYLVTVEGEAAEEELAGRLADMRDAGYEVDWEEDVAP